MRLEGDVEWSSAKAVLVTNPGGGLGGILTKFADARKLGKIASVSEYRMKIQNYWKNWTKNVRILRGTRTN